MFLCRKSREIFFTRLKNVQREACFTVLSGKSQLIKELVCLTKWRNMKLFSLQIGRKPSMFLQLLIRPGAELFYSLHSNRRFVSVVLLCCLVVSTPIDLLITLKVSQPYHCN